MPIESHGRVEPVSAAWDDLADRVGAVPWLRPGWIAAWLEAFGRGRLEVLTVRRNGVLVGVVPCEHRGGLTRSTTNWHTPQFGLLVEDARAGRELAEALVARSKRRLSLAFVPADGGLGDVRAAARAARFRVLERTLQRSPYLAIDGEWDSYRTTLSRNHRYDIRRKRARLEDEGAVSVDVADGSERLEALLDEGFRVEAAGWKGVRGTAVASRPETERLYRSVARWAAARGTLRLAFLRLDGRPLAFHLNLEDGGIHYHLKGGYDVAYERFSPGKVLHAALIERAFAKRLARYEFLGADEAYKLAWTGGVTRRLELVEAFAPSLAGLAEWSAFTYGRPAAKRALALARSARALRGARRA